jgi:hypothetical protein
VIQVLVQWSGNPGVYGHWEDLDLLRQRFPRASTWGQGEFQKKGVVNNPVVPINDNTTEATKAQDQAHEDCRRREKNTPGWLADIDLGQTEKGHVIV